MFGCRLGAVGRPVCLMSHCADDRSIGGVQVGGG
jgi:hypothetical protein